MINLRVQEAKNVKVAQWSGGETREVFLAPDHGVYKVGQFDFRVSSATVELKESKFSALPGYERLIMSLDHCIRLVHETEEEIEEIILQPFEAHHFSGDDQTTSYGQCTDFNLIYKPELKGFMKACNKAEQLTLESEVTVIYCLEDVDIQVIKNEELIKSYQLEKYSSLVLENPESHTRVEFDSQESFQPIVVCSMIQEK